MPAPDLETLFDLETAIEEGMQRLLGRSDIVAYTQREFENLKTPRVDLQLAVGGATGHRHRDKDGQFWYDAWSYRLTIGLCTERDDVAEPRRHALFRARIRILMQYGSGKIDDATIFPWHVLTQVIDAGTAPSVVTGDDCDMSELAYSGVLSIRSNAWPVASAPTADDTTTTVDSDQWTVDSTQP